MRTKRRPVDLELAKLVEWLSNGEAWYLRLGEHDKQRGAPTVLILDQPVRVGSVGAVVLLKCRRKDITEQQHKWLERFREAGWQVVLAWSAAEAIAELQKHVFSQ
jgi:hypothetical protein